MVRKFDLDATKEYFNHVFFEDRKTRDVSDPEAALHARDHIFLRNVLPNIPKNHARILDYGCGHGELLRKMITLGYDTWGVEKHKMVSSYTRRVLKDISAEDRVLTGSLDRLSKMRAGSFDVVVAMGVLQYLDHEQYKMVLDEFRRILGKSGTFVCTFQNALFDLYTFNKYTIDFFVNELLGPYIENEGERRGLQESLESIVVNPHAPPKSRDVARDNIFVRITNPLTVAEELKKFGFSVQDKYFYNFFGVPPVIQNRHPAIHQRITRHFEVDNAKAWQGHFMANAFLVSCTCDDL